MLEIWINQCDDFLTAVPYYRMLSSFPLTNYQMEFEGESL